MPRNGRKRLTYGRFGLSVRLPTAEVRKKELIHRRSWPDREELRREVFDYIETFYNPVRRHSTLGMLSPVNYEAEVARIVVEVQ